MSSLKRKVGPGGCDETESSGSESGVTHAPPKKPKPFVIPPLKSSPFAALSALSKSKSLEPKRVSAVPGVSKTPKEGHAFLIPPIPCGMSLTADKSGHEVMLPSTDNGSLNLLESPAISSRKQNAEKTEESSDDDSVRPTTVAVRSRIHFERGLNAIRTNLETFQADVNARLTCIEESQAQSKKQHDLVLAKLDEILSQSNSNMGSTSMSNPPTVPTIEEEKPTKVDTNPKADPGLYTVCQEIDRAKAIGAEFGVFESPIKSIIRRGMYVALGIQDFTRPPMFYSKNGVPDFFPEEFHDEKGYCQPYLHWDSSFATNFDCIPTCILNVRAILPNNDTPLGKAARALTDNQIIALICHGPFKTLKNRFNTLKVNSLDDLDVQEAGKRGVSRQEAKWFQRQGFRFAIKGLLNSSWDVVSHKGVMSPEIKDKQGGFIVERPFWRAGWFNTTLTAADSAYWALQPASIRNRRAKRTIKLVEVPPPTNLRSADGKLLKIPLCMISKQWRKENQTWMEDMTHLLDTSLSKKPDTLAYVTAHLTPVEPPVEPKGKARAQEVDEDEEDEEREGEVGGEEGGDSEEANQEDGWLAGPSTRRVLDEEPGQVDFGPVASAERAGDGNNDFYTLDPALTLSQSQVYVPIDPLLPKSPEAPAQPARSYPCPRPCPRSGSPHIDTPDPDLQADLFRLPAIWFDPSAPLPPPPPLPEQDVATTPAPEPSQTTTKKGQKVNNPLPTNPPNEPMKKKRGRPAGSLNKKTLAKLAAAAAVVEDKVK